jgi:hypothetical protein
MYTYLILHHFLILMPNPKNIHTQNLYPYYDWALMQWICLFIAIRQPFAQVFLKSVVELQ